MAIFQQWQGQRRWVRSMEGTQLLCSSRKGTDKSITKKTTRKRNWQPGNTHLRASSTRPAASCALQKHHVIYSVDETDYTIWRVQWHNGHYAWSRGISYCTAFSPPNNPGLYGRPPRFIGKNMEAAEVPAICSREYGAGQGCLASTRRSVSRLLVTQGHHFVRSNLIIHKVGENYCT